MGYNNEPERVCGGGNTNSEITYGAKKPHIQSYFVVLNKNVIKSDVLSDFFNSIEKQENKRLIIIKYEQGLTKTLENEGFTWTVYSPISKKFSSSHLLKFQELIKKDKIPFLKTSICRNRNVNTGIHAGTIYDYIDKNTKYDVNLIYNDLKNKQIVENMSKSDFIEYNINLYKSQQLKFHQKIFSVTNKEQHKIIIIFGTKIKLRTKNIKK